jgi:Putative transposase
MVQPWNEPERDGHAPFPVSRWQATCLPRITISLPFANSEFTFANNLRLNTFQGDFGRLPHAARSLLPDLDYLAPLRAAEWVVYAKRPFARPEQLLDYVGRYTHRVAISNNRLLDIAEDKVTFRYKDYRHDAQQKIMTVEAQEFIRRFLLHVLPEGFQRIRYYGFLANRYREEKLARCRELLDMPAPEPPALEAAKDYRERYQELIGPSLGECPVCHQGRMLVIEILPRSPHRKTAITDTS